MKHTLKVVNPKADTISESFGVDHNEYVKMVDNIILELVHNIVFEKDRRTKVECVLDVLESLDADELGVDLSKSEHYFLLGVAFAAADRTKSAFLHGLRHEAESEDVVEGVMSEALQHLRKVVEDKGMIKPTGKKETIH